MVYNDSTVIKCLFKMQWSNFLSTSSTFLLLFILLTKFQCQLSFDTTLGEISYSNSTLLIFISPPCGSPSTSSNKRSACSIKFCTVQVRCDLNANSLSLSSPHSCIVAAVPLQFCKAPAALQTTDHEHCKQIVIRSLAEHEQPSR